MIKNIAIIYNTSSENSSTAKSDIRKAFKLNGQQLLFIDIKRPTKYIIQEIKDNNIQLIAAAGGDGTVNAVANIALQTNLPMAVLPTGTLNHFAKDVGIPLKLEEAVRAIQNEEFDKLDYCTVNGHVFVNNSSIGLYSETVIKREQLQPRLGKWIAAVMASLSAVWQLSSTHLNLESGGKRHHYKTPLIFIGNNSYGFNQIGFTNRQSLTGGSLFIYVVRANS